MSTKTSKVAKKFVHILLGHEILVKFSKYPLGLFSSIHSLILKNIYHMANQIDMLLTKGIEHNRSIPKSSIELM